MITIALLETGTRTSALGLSIWSSLGSFLTVAAAMLLAAQGRSEGTRLEMTLRQAVAAARSSRAMRTALLQRTASRNELRVAEHEFKPFLDVSGKASTTDQSSSSASGSRDREAGAAARLRLALQTGASFAWEVTGSAADTSNDDSTHRYGHALTLTQPLLKGRGTEVATANQRLARLGDQSAALSLAASASDVIDNTVFAYRNLLAAREELSITEKSLEAAHDMAAISDSLIAAGRLPASEKVQSETDIANRELAVLVSRNTMAQAQLELVSTLDLPLDTDIVPVDTIAVERRIVDFDQALRTRLARSPEYRDQLLAVEAARINLRVAENGRQVELNANAGLAQNWVGSAWNRDWVLGLSLGHVLFDPAPDVARVNARLALEEAELALAKTEDAIRIDLRQRLRNLEVAWRRLELATRARDLTARQLEIEREKLQAGRSASFQVVRFRNDLDDAANTELAASINYANEITRLDRSLGVTLEVWGIDLETEVAQISPGAAGAGANRNGGKGKQP